MPTKLLQPAKRGANDKRLTPNQQLFVEALLADPKFNATAAAKAAGYGAPGQAANKLMKDPVVTAIIGKEIRMRAEKFEVKAEHVLRELAAIGGANPQNLVDENGVLIPLEKLPKEVAAAVKSFKVTEKVVEGKNGKPVTLRVTDVVLHDKVTALDMLSKHLGLYEKDNQQKPNVVFDLSRLYQRPVIVDPVEAAIARASEPAKIGEVVEPPKLTYDVDEFDGDRIDL